MRRTIYIFLTLFIFLGCAYTNSVYAELTNIGKIGKIENQDKVLGIANKIISAIIDKDFITLSKYVDKEEGLIISLFPVIAVNNVTVFSTREVEDFSNTKKEYKWGIEEGSGETFISTPQKFFQLFMDVPLSRISKVGLNKMITDPGYTENQWVIFPDSIVIEYYIDPSPDYSGMDWLSVRLILKSRGDSYSLVGLTSFHQEM